MRALSATVFTRSSSFLKSVSRNVSRISVLETEFDCFYHASSPQISPAVCHKSGGFWPWTFLWVLDHVTAGGVCLTVEDEILFLGRVRLRECTANLYSLLAPSSATWKNLPICASFHSRICFSFGTDTPMDHFSLIIFRCFASYRRILFLSISNATYTFSTGYCMYDDLPDRGRTFSTASIESHAQCTRYYHPVSG